MLNWVSQYFALNHYQSYCDLVETLLPVENFTGVLHVRLLQEFRCRSDGMLNWVSQIGRPSSWGVCKGIEYFTLHRYQPKKALLSHSGLTLSHLVPSKVM